MSTNRPGRPTSTPARLRSRDRTPSVITTTKAATAKRNIELPPANEILVWAFTILH